MKKAIDRENRALIEAEADALLFKLTIDGAGTVWTATPPAYVDPAAGQTEMMERTAFKAAQRGVYECIRLRSRQRTDLRYDEGQRRDAARS